LVRGTCKTVLFIYYNCIIFIINVKDNSIYNLPSFAKSFGMASNLPIPLPAVAGLLPLAILNLPKSLFDKRDFFLFTPPLPAPRLLGSKEGTGVDWKEGVGGDLLPLR
jgi:hypothetical protein